MQVRGKMTMWKFAVLAASFTGETLALSSSKLQNDLAREPSESKAADSNVADPKVLDSGVGAAAKKTYKAAEAMLKTAKGAKEKEQDVAKKTGEKLDPQNLVPKANEESHNVMPTDDLWDPENRADVIKNIKSGKFDASQLAPTGITASGILLKPFRSLNKAFWRKVKDSDEFQELRDETLDEETDEWATGKAQEAHRAAQGVFLPGLVR